MYLTEHAEFTESNRWFYPPRRIKPTFSTFFPVSSVSSSERRERVRKNPGFTLLELLVVISIIAILAGMVFPTFHYAKKRAREAKARVAVKQLETAFKSYLDTYKVWPAGFADGDIKDDIFKVMRGEDISSMNPQGIAFFEFESFTNYPSQTTAYDPWSDPSDSSSLQAYQVMFDKDYDNKITLPVSGKDVYRCVLVWSFGEDRTNDEGEEDDVASWK